MTAKHVLLIAGLIFLALATGRIVRDRGTVGPAARTWLIVGVVFSAVSTWLWFGIS